MVLLEWRNSNSTVDWIVENEKSEREAHASSASSSVGVVVGDDDYLTMTFKFKINEWPAALIHSLFIAPQQVDPTVHCISNTTIQ